MGDLVSVLIPLYNSQDYIVETINSVVNQSYKNLEIIIVNDCSTDESVRMIIDNFNDKRIKIIENEYNMGIVNTLNKGIRYCKGMYVARLDSDDICELDRIETQLNYMKQNDLDVCGSAIRRFGLQNCVEEYPKSDWEVRIASLMSCPFAHPAVMVKRNVFDNYLYSSDTKVEDYDLWCRLIQNNFKCGNTREILLNYRIHKNSLSNSNNPNYKRLVSDYITCIKKQNLELLNIVLSDEQVKILFLNQNMLYGFNYKEKEVFNTFWKYQENVYSRIANDQKEYFDYCLEKKLYEKTIILSSFKSLYYFYKTKIYGKKIKQYFVILYKILVKKR